MKEHCIDTRQNQRIPDGCRISCEFVSDNRISAVFKPYRGRLPDGRYIQVVPKSITLKQNQLLPMLVQVDSNTAWMVTESNTNH